MNAARDSLLPQQEVPGVPHVLALASSGLSADGTNCHPPLFPLSISSVGHVLRFHLALHESPRLLRPLSSRFLILAILCTARFHFFLALLQRPPPRRLYFRFLCLLSLVRLALLCPM